MSQKIANISDQERFDRLRLLRSENVGPITFQQLLQHYGNAAEALIALPELARRGGRKRPIKIAAIDKVTAEIDAAAACGARHVAIGENGYPPALVAIADSPPIICIKGHEVIARRPMLGIVGARNASASAIRFTSSLAAELGRHDLVIASGMARGIDAAAHQGALAGGTLAVVAGGIDVVYPLENQKLYDEIVERGLVISEMPPGTTPQARHFPRRNRLISGVSLGVLVVEAALRSGSLITARMALEQGREVFAVPGSPLDPRCRGANQLIRQGAVLTETVEDIISVIELMVARPLAEPDELYRQTAIGPDEAIGQGARTSLEALLGPTAVEIDELIRQSDLTPAVVLTILLELELAGRLERHAGQRVSMRL